MSVCVVCVDQCLFTFDGKKVEIVTLQCVLLASLNFSVESAT